MATDEGAIGGSGGDTATREQERLCCDLVDLLLHDLRSPLATALLGVEAIERALEREDPDRAQRSLEMLAATLRRLSRLVDSLLDISRLEAGQPFVRPSTVDLGELLLQVVHEVSLAVATHGLHLELEVPSGLPTIVADRDMVFRAVINLLDNAIKFSPAGSQVCLRVTPQDQGLTIAVTDQGPGIPRELQARIFDKFVGSHLPQAPRGYGLGLSFCKLAVEAHDGQVSVDSEPGRGSTFSLWFPVTPP